jgi:hypothetical protein
MDNIGRVTGLSGQYIEVAMMATPDDRLKKH